MIPMKNHLQQANTLPGTVRVLIADDVPLVRQGLATMLRLATKKLQPEIEVVGEARNGWEAIEQARLLHPDVVLMDLEMPIMDGFNATHSIKSMSPSIWVIVLTIHSDPFSRYNAEQAGADAFIEKGAPISDILQAITRSGMSA